jgi:hypothetical protein
MDDPDAVPLRKVLTTDVAEIAALRVIVVAMASILAKDFEAAGGGKAQVWIRQLAETTLEGLNNSTFTDDRGHELSGIRERAVDYAKVILGTIDCDSSELRPGIGLN